MNIAVQYVTDSTGKPQAVQLSLTDWEALMEKLKGYEQTFAPKDSSEEVQSSKSATGGNEAEDLPYFDAAPDWDIEASVLRDTSNNRRATSW